LTTAQRVPDRVQAIVLVDIAPTMQRQGVSHIIDFMTGNPEGFASVEEAASAVSRFLPHRKARPSARLEHNLRYSPETERWTWHWDPNTVNFATEEHLRAQTDDMTAAVRTLDVPMILIRGEHSDVVVPEDVKHFLGLSPHARVAEVPGARHMVAGDANEVFLRQIRSELERALPDWPRAERSSSR
jgi:pimeloyl-ACP methyl ester carboxylesterase